MLKLCLNPNYKQVLGELSQPVSIGSTPGHCVHCCTQGFFLVQFKINPEEKKKKKQSSSVRGKRHTTRVLWCTKFCHRPHDDEKVPYAHFTDLYWGGNAIKWWNIMNAILYIGLITWCHESLHLEKIPSWSRLKRAHYVSKPFDLLEIRITFLLQLSKFW